MTDQSYAVHLRLIKDNGDRHASIFVRRTIRPRGQSISSCTTACPKFMYGLYLTADDPSVLINHGFVDAIGEV